MVQTRATRPTLVLTLRPMNTSVVFRRACCALWLGLSLSAVQAGKPDGVEGGAHGKPAPHHPNKDRQSNRPDDRHHRDDRRDGGQRSDDDRAVAGGSGVSVQIQIGGYFNGDQRHAARAYYEPRWRAGNCPPGLAKKGNGCQPPGQAKRWQRGQPLPRDVVYHPVPASVQVQLGTPPAGYQLVRVATDILLIAVGTRLVIDAIEDPGQP